MQDRFERLAPYRVLKTRRGVLGSSRYARKLRQELREAAKDPCLLYTSPSPRDAHESRMPSSA